MQIMQMLKRLMSKSECLIMPKGTKFEGSGKLGLMVVKLCAALMDPFCCKKWWFLECKNSICIIFEFLRTSISAQNHQVCRNCSKASNGVGVKF